MFERKISNESAKRHSEGDWDRKRALHVGLCCTDSCCNASVLVSLLFRFCCVLPSFLCGKRLFIKHIGHEKSLNNTKQLKIFNGMGTE